MNRDIFEKARKAVLERKPKTKEDAEKLLRKIREKHTLSDREMGELIFGEYSAFADRIGKCQMNGDVTRFVFRFAGDDVLYGIDSWVYDTRVVFAFVGEVTPYRKAELTIRFHNGTEKGDDSVTVSQSVKNREKIEEMLNDVIRETECAF